jgi:MSHA biogenesis protein MshP
MCLNRCDTSPSAQRGFLLPVAVFILVVMSVAALALWRSSIQTSRATVQELISAQALYAAESGAQAGVGQVLASANRTTANAVCDALNLSQAYSVTGLQRCSAQVSCRVILNPPSPSDTSSVYEVISQGRCGTSVTAERSIMVAAYLEDNTTP